MKKIVLASAIALLSATPAFAAPGNTSSANGAASATIVQPIVLTHVSSAALAFGTITTGAGGSVVITAAGSTSYTGEVTSVPGVAPSADAFTVAGDSNRSYAITTGSGSVTSGSNSIAFTTAPSASNATLSGGAGSFTVGGTLTLTGTEVAGSYTGSYPATVTYN
ncbi:hypothetical protein AQZ52_08135 [Novosphingobium fuchskuhlense]|uniref:DUF4402 domain-containing protein n=1 Tax=Novosphingobium fuchskuhlense TaxID=1117702 RepID=A0A117UVF1_9SPHN|nr:DUF4402 domain-containing protein [Novosphingobium fuchskuhlense]KUR71581.1 hypothetical protein AQZ52_08135 [Novosphingobium fuchskuhlense]